MKVIISENTENKLVKFYQDKIDEVLTILKQRYKDEEISASNWYLAQFSRVDDVKVLMVKIRKSDILVFIDVDGEYVDGNVISNVGFYFTDKLEPFGKPTIIPVE